MAERCPLDFKGDSEFELPDLCMEQCQELWSSAPELSEYDRYDTDKGCMADTEFSCDALYVVDDQGTRRYARVDQCTRHEEEVGQQDYQFTCPYSLPNRNN